MIHPAEASLIFQPLETKSASPIRMWGNLFKDVSKLPFANERKGCLTYPRPIEEPSKLHPLQLNVIDLRVDENCVGIKEARSTDEIMLKHRGTFRFDVYFFREFDPKIDMIQLSFHPDNRALEKLSVTVEVDNDDPVKLPVKVKETFAKIVDRHKEALTIHCQFGEDSPSFGIWKMMLITKLNASSENHGEECVSIVKGLRFAN